MQQFGPWLGMSQKPNPRHIKNEWLQYAEDVDFARNTLAPMRSDRQLSEDTGASLYLGDCCLNVFQTCVNVATDPNGCGRVFASGLEDIDYPVTATKEGWCTEDRYKMGWPCTFIAPTVSYTASTVSDRIAEGRSYVYTYTNVFGEESQPSLPSFLQIVDFDVPAIISGFEVLSPEYGAKTLNIYALVAGMSKTVGGGSEGNDEYLRVATLPINTLMFTHSPLLQSLGEALITDEYVPVSETAHDFQHWGMAQLAYQDNGSLRFTEPYNYSASPIKYMYTPKANLVRVVATQEYVYMLTCSQPEVVTSKAACDMSGVRNTSVIDDAYPIIGRLSAVAYENTAIFASTTGLVQVHGANAAVITDQIFTQHQWDSLQPQTMRGAVYNGYYYGATDTCAFRFEIAKGPKSGYAEKFSYLSIRPTAWFTTTDDRLLYLDDTGVHELGQGGGFKSFTAVTKDVYELGQSIHTSFRIDTGIGNTLVEQTVIGDNGSSSTSPYPVKKSGTYKFKRSLGSGVHYTIKGDTEVSAFTVGNSVHSIIGKV